MHFEAPVLDLFVCTFIYKTKSNILNVQKLNNFVTKIIE